MRATAAAAMPQGNNKHGCTHEWWSWPETHVHMPHLKGCWSGTTRMFAWLRWYIPSSCMFTCHTWWVAEVALKERLQNRTAIYHLHAWSHALLDGLLKWHSENVCMAALIYTIFMHGHMPYLMGCWSGTKRTSAKPHCYIPSSCMVTCHTWWVAEVALRERLQNCTDIYHLHAWSHAIPDGLLKRQ